MSMVLVWHTRTKETAPIFDESATMIFRRALLSAAFFVSASSNSYSVYPASTSTPPTVRKVGVECQLLKHRCCRRPDKRPLIRADLGCWHHQRHVRHVSQRIGNEQAERQSADPQVPAEVLHNVQRRRPRVDDNCLALADQGCDCRADSLLGLDMLRAAKPGSKLRETLEIAPPCTLVRAPRTSSSSRSLRTVISDACNRSARSETLILPLAWTASQTSCDDNTAPRIQGKCCDRR